MSPAPAPVRPAAVVASSPYPWPYHGGIAVSATALVCCLDERWRGDGPVASAAGERLGVLARRLSALGALVVAVHGAGPAGRGGAPLFPVDITLEAAGTSAFFGSRLDAVLRASGRRDLVVAGWGFEGPVHSTLRAANDRGYECLLIPDACSLVDPALVDSACSMVCMSGGIFGAVALCEHLLAALAGAQSTGDVQSPGAIPRHIDDERTFA